LLPELMFFGKQGAPVLQLVAASEQQPALFSFHVKRFVGGAASELRKFPAFAGAAITIADLLTQIV